MTSIVTLPLGAISVSKELKKPYLFNGNMMLFSAAAVSNAFLFATSTHKYDHITPVLKELKWLPVATQLYFRSAIMAFKCLTSRVPEYLSSQFSKRGEISGRATRSSQMLNIPLFKSASGQRTFYYRTVSIWNSMDSSLKTLEKVSAFKFYLKRKLIKDFIDS